ncbi:MAG TPA: NUDIX hydrolase [Micromonosporaceae bacterium]|nr:NUDIX hydrolase [Micromonosporaceae bacterium]
MSVEDRRAARLERYEQLRRERPPLFVNPPDAAYEIVFDRAAQEEVADAAAAWLRGAGKPEEYGDIGVVYEDRFVIAVRDAVRFRDGTLGPYIRFLGVHTGTNAAVLPLLDDGRILLVRHFRHERRTWAWETPRGFSEDGADGATTAVKELEEEIGVRVTEVELLGRVPGDGGPDEIYLARLRPESVAGPTLPAGAAAEGIDEMRLVTVAELRRMIADGELDDPYVLAAYAFAVAKGILPVT